MENIIPKGTTLEPAKRYKIKHCEGNKIINATRIFKWMESRFESIPCFVFTSKVDKSVKARFEDNMLYISGRRIPKQEVSIPLYDLLEIKEAE
jgi:hypothetical protein